MSLAEYLAERSQAICSDNSCDLENDEHNCESYAYINKNLQLLDICMPDYFQGSSDPYAAIPLPFSGSQSELEKLVEADIDSDI